MDKKEKEKELQKLISLTFDEKPEVRKGAALKLAESDEPAAVFALLELSYDKDESVKAAARLILSKKEPKNKDEISFASIFAQGAEKEEEQPVLPTTPEEDLKKKKLLYPVEQIFEKKLGKTKAGIAVKDKMMDTIQKIYLKAVGGTKPEDSQKREKSMQKMLTSYADVLSGLDQIMGGAIENEAEVPIQTISANPASKEDEKDLEIVGTSADPAKITRDISELVEGGEEEVIRKEISHSVSEDSAERGIFRKAYELMMASDGDEEVMLAQSQKLLKQLQDDVQLAFRLAKQRFKAENITHLTELRDGMKNVSTDVLKVKAVTFGEYPRTKTKNDTYVRIIVNDGEGSEGIIYLFEGRGKEVLPGMSVKVSKGMVKTFSFSGETGLTITKRGNVYIVL